MIKYDMLAKNKEEHFKVEGSKSVIMTELASLLHHLYTTNFFNEKDLNEMVRLAMLSNEEIETEIYSGTAMVDMFIRALSGDEVALKLLQMLSDEVEE